MKGWLTGASAGVLIGLMAVLTSCADADHPATAFEGPWVPAPDVPTRAHLTCGPDDSMTLAAEVVQPRPDGIHVRVTNRLDETVSVAGFDADPGVTDYVFTGGPSTMELMCWPFSEHRSGEEPRRVPLEIVDPVGLYVDSSLSCHIEMHTISDYFESPIDEGPPPLDVAREVIEGLRQDDELRVGGYPEQEGGPVIVIREGEIVARYGITRFKGRPWAISSGSACEGTGLRFEGESVS